MRRIALIVSCLAALVVAGPAAAEPLGCGVSDTRPLWAEFSDGTVAFRQAIFGRPGVVVATSGVQRAAEMRALGAQTVYWQRALKLIVGTPSVPYESTVVQEKVATLIANARASAGCETPAIALNELSGAQRATPWPPEVIRYRENVLSVMKQLAGAGLRPFLLVPGQSRGSRAPYVGDTAGQWWKQAANVGYIVREMHFDAPYIYSQGAIVGSRMRRVAMRTSIEAFTDIGVPAGRLGLMLGFQSGPGKGGREGLKPSYKWFDIVKRDALAAKQVARELPISSIWSWGWGTFDEAGADPDKPRTACVYLWTRDQGLCDAPAVAGSRFNASLLEGQIILPVGVQCRTGAGPIRSAAVDTLVPAAGSRDLSVDRAAHEARHPWTWCACQGRRYRTCEIASDRPAFRGRRGRVPGGTRAAQHRRRTRRRRHRRPVPLPGGRGRARDIGSGEADRHLGSDEGSFGGAVGDLRARRAARRGRLQLAEDPAVPRDPVGIGFHQRRRAVVEAR